MDLVDPFVRVHVESMHVDGVEGPLIHRFDLEIPKGQIAALVGPSGAGKTTLLRIIAGLETSFEGTVTIDGSDVIGPQRVVQMVFQDRRLLPWKTVEKNLAFAISSSDADVKDRISNWLRFLGLDGKEHQWPKFLSGGEESRVAFARALLAEPLLLLLDEPFTGLDVATKLQLQSKLTEIAIEKNMTVLLTSHDPGDAIYLSDVVYVLEKAPLRVKLMREVPRRRPRQREDRVLIELESEILSELQD